MDRVHARAGVDEVELVAAITGMLTQAGSTWTDRDGSRRPLTLDDILIVAPYNLQRIRISALLNAAGHPVERVGTVAKFQGQEAAVVFYSMSMSSSQTLPRAAAFLFVTNRIYVAISPPSSHRTLSRHAPRVLVVARG